MDTQTRILVVEDSRVFGASLKRRLETHFDLQVVWAQSLAEARATLAGGREFLVAVLDFCLPDAPEGEIIDVVTDAGIPAIVFTGDLSAEVQEFLWTKRLVDYVVKEGHRSIDAVVEIIARLRRNPSIKILVVDDSKAARKHLCNLLETHRYRVLEAANGQEALDVFLSTPDIMLVITDYEMPRMDGFELTRQIRSRCGVDRVGIIGLSASGNHRTSVRFMKNGANDFLNKPFICEHLYCRILQNITLVESFQAVRAMSYTDYLTKLGNRRHFFESVDRMQEQHSLRGRPLTACMIDVDHFKRVNDTYGHEAGDVVLRKIASILAEGFPSPHLTCRFGGEEFCVLTLDIDEASARLALEEVRLRIQRTVIGGPPSPISVTVSLGMSHRTDGDVRAMVKEADEWLYAAKTQGRNRLLGAWAQPSQAPVARALPA